MEEIGRRLRSAREALGITLEQAEDETKIRRKYLEALECANQAEIPGEVYLKGFLRTYGNYVGLDGTELVEAYKLAGGEPDRLSPALAPERSESVGVRQAAPVGRPGSAPLPGRERSERSERSKRPVSRRSGGSPGTRLLLIALILLTGVAYVGWLIFRQAGPTAAPPAAPPPVVEQSKAPDPLPKPPEPAPKPPEPAPPKVTMARGRGEDVIFTVAAKAIQVKVEPGSRAVWLQAEVDGKSVYAATTTQPLEVTGTRIRIRAGHMEGVSLVINGQRFDNPLDAVTYNLIFNGE